jgi:hypothetical protein
MMLCVYIEVVRVANDHLNCLEVAVGVTLVGASAPSAHYTHIYNLKQSKIMRYLHSQRTIFFQSTRVHHI